MNTWSFASNIYVPTGQALVMGCFKERHDGFQIVFV